MHMKLSWQLLSSVINDLGKVYDGRARYLRLFNVIRKCERIYRSKKSKRSLSDKHAEAADLIANVCRQNGAMWIKVAQYLSCRPDVLPLEYVQAFSDMFKPFHIFSTPFRNFQACWFYPGDVCFSWKHPKQNAWEKI